MASRSQDNPGLKDILLDEACRVLNADRHTAARLLPLFESSSYYRFHQSSSSDEVKGACGAALVSFLLLHLVLPAKSSSSKTLPKNNRETAPPTAASTGATGDNEKTEAEPGGGSEGTSSYGEERTITTSSKDDARDDDAHVENQMLGLATALASFLSQQNADTPGSVSPLTALDVVHHCTQTLKSGTVSQLLLNKPQTSAAPPQSRSSNVQDEAILRKLDIVVDMLRQIESEIKATSSTYREMDDVWSWACDELLKDRTLRREQVENARETAWLLHCTLSVVRPTFGEGDDGEEAIVSSKLQPGHRRRIYLCACMIIVFESLTDDRSGTKRPRDRQDDSSSRKKKQQKTTVEDEREAIAALSMMPTSAPSSPPNSDAGSSAPSSPTPTVQTQLVAKMSLGQGHVIKAIESVESWLAKEKPREKLGTFANLKDLRNMYHDRLMENVTASLGQDVPTLAWMGVVDEVMFYHEEQVRECSTSMENIQIPIVDDQESKDRWQQQENEDRLLHGGNVNSQWTKREYPDENEEGKAQKRGPPHQDQSTSSGDKLRNESDSPSSTDTSVSEWIARLCHDPTLAKPSHPLTLHFDHSGGVSLWNTITSILDRALQRLSDYVGDAIEKSDREANVRLDQPQALPHLVSDSGELVRSSQHGSTALDSAGNNTLRQQIQTSVLALYYYSLESIVTLETIRLHTKAHPQLLSNATFHRSLLAVGAQSVLKAMSLNNTSQLQFPVILDIMEVDAYDFLKVSECFVRAVWSKDQEPSPEEQGKRQHLGLPLELRKHLQECEELILDKLLWDTTLGKSGGIRAAIEAMRNHESEFAWPPFSLRDETESFEQQRREAGNLARHLTKQQQQHHVTVSFVFRKLVTLSARRILELSEILCLDAFVTEQIWITWRHCLAEHVYLLYDRHVDQMILCTVYGVCKIARVTPDVSFAKIIESYYEANPGRDRMNQFIIRHIPLGEGKRQGNVIHLYNQVYVPSMKGHLLKFQHHASQQRAKAGVTNENDSGRAADSGPSGGRYSNTDAAPGSTYATKCSLLPVKGTLHTVSPSRVENTNVYVSMCKEVPTGDGGNHAVSSFGMSSARNHLPPQSRSLYSFGEASPHEISVINQTVNYSGYGHSQHVSISDDDEHDRPQFHRHTHQNGIGVGPRRNPYHPPENHHSTFAPRPYLNQRRR